MWFTISVWCLSAALALSDDDLYGEDLSLPSIYEDQGDNVTEFIAKYFKNLGNQNELLTHYLERQAECPCGLSNEELSLSYHARNTVKNNETAAVDYRVPIRFSTAQQQRIYNGTTVSPDHKYPWMVYIKTTKNGKTFLCTGSIVSKSFILTAAHCFVSSGRITSSSSVRVTVGDFSRSATDDVEGVTKTVPVTRIIVHPELSLNLQQNDIALLQLQEPLDLRSYEEIRSICLPREYTSYNNRQLQYAGWGETNPESDIKFEVMELQETTGIVTDPCSYGSINDYLSKFCFHGDRQTSFACVGDSGGPVMTVTGGRYQIVGIIAHEEYTGEDPKACGDKFSKLIVMKVAYYMNWIQKHVDLSC